MQAFAPMAFHTRIAHGNVPRPFAHPAGMDNSIITRLDPGDDGGQLFPVGSGCLNVLACNLVIGVLSMFGRMVCAGTDNSTVARLDPGDYGGRSFPVGFRCFNVLASNVVIGIRLMF